MASQVADQRGPRCPGPLQMPARQRQAQLVDDCAQLGEFGVHDRDVADLHCGVEAPQVSPHRCLRHVACIGERDGPRPDGQPLSDEIVGHEGEVPGAEGLELRHRIGTGGGKLQRLRGELLRLGKSAVEALVARAGDQTCQFRQHPGPRDSLRLGKDGHRPLTEPAYGHADVRIAADALHDCARLRDEVEAFGACGDGNHGRGGFQRCPVGAAAALSAREFQQRLGTFAGRPGPGGCCTGGPFPGGCGAEVGQGQLGKADGLLVGEIGGRDSSRSPCPQACSAATELIGCRTRPVRRDLGRAHA